jgi:SAM-dependent methyltransferase
MTYSNQLMEHLHPEDAYEQLCNIYNVLTPGGMYLCVTPNRLFGPHDISKYFDDVATGFHLKEYTVTELEAIFKKAGFSKIRLLLGAKGLYILFPTSPVRWLEGFLGKLSYALSRKISFLLPVKLLLGIKLVAIK